jgi:long-chain acyl-CoA synthetase
MDLSTTPKPWLELYGERPRNIAAGFRDMLALFRATVDSDESADAIIYSGMALSYRWLDDRSDELAVWLADRGGLLHGARVAIILQNVPEFLIATLGAWKIGAIPVPINPMYQERELNQLFLDARPRAVICHDEQVVTVVNVLRACGSASPLILKCSRDETTTAIAALDVPSNACIDGTYRFNQVLAARRGARPMQIRLKEIDTGLLLYTSGTTGSPKGAVLSHGALAFNSFISQDWFNVRPTARVLAIAPLFHIIGFQCEMCTAFLSRGSVVLDYRFDAERTLDLMRVHRPTFMIATITAYIALMNHPLATAAHFSSFDTLYAGGGPVPTPVVNQFEARFGKRIALAYGMTETCAPTHVVPYEHASPVDAASGTLSIGIPVSNADAMIELADGTRAPVGEAGELLLRGPMLMDGYLNKPEATAQALKDGWMHTGDVAVMDQRGWFFLIDRKKDVIIASGFKVWPREIEDVLYMHPSVREAAAVGVPDSYRCETIRAFVSLRPTLQCTAAELTTLCRTQLAAYKVPRQIDILLELPKTATGKIMRVELRNIASAEETTADRNA